jgi:hypothetical protein
VNVKVLYIGRESDVIVTCFVGGIESGMWCYELIQMVGIEWHVFSEPRESDIFMAKLQTRYWAGWGVACGKITSAVRHRLNYCGYARRLQPHAVNKTAR